MSFQRNAHETRLCTDALMKTLQPDTQQESMPVFLRGGYGSVFANSVFAMTYRIELQQVMRTNYSTLSHKHLSNQPLLEVPKVM